MASKRKQDEKHLKMLREMVALPHNKQCFDCHQRGPTYVNMTIGAYVCTACSGILRGINPPHRVKSISMASFTSEEIDFIKCHGNDFCRKVWLGLFDSRTSSEPDSKDEQKVKDFMAQKYERKRWYVAPTDAMKEEAKQLNEVATNKQPTTKPLKSLLGENAPKLVVQNNQQTPKNPPPVQAPTSVSSAAPQKSFPSPGTQSQSSQSSGSVTMDLLGDLGGDPFASATPAPVSQPTVSSGGEGGFADFANFNQFSAQTPTQSFPAFQSASNPLVPLGGSTTSTSTPAPIPDGGFGGITAPPVTSTASSGDKYSALTDLFSDSVPASTQSSSVNWSGGGGTTGSTSGINWSGGSSGSTGISWGGTSSTPSSGGIDWNSSGNTTSDNSGLNWNNTGTTNTSNGGVGWSTSTNSSAGFPATGSVSNPFGGVSTSVPSQAVGGGITNPFGGASQNMFGGTGGFGQPTQGMGQQQIGGMGQQQLAGIGQPAPNAAGFGHPGGFGQSAFGQTGFGGTPGTMGAGFGGAPGVGGVPQSGAQFGQFGMQNGGTGFNQASSSSAGAFQQTMPTSVGGAMNLSSGQFDNKLGGTQSTQGFPAGWGQTSQQPVANPFMSAASQPMASKTGSTNPFL